MKNALLLYLFAAVLSLGPQGAMAQDSAGLRPQPRPETAAPTASPVAPKPRPATAAPAAPPKAAAAPPSALLVARSPRPKPRPRSVVRAYAAQVAAPQIEAMAQSAQPAQPSPSQNQPRKGSVCGDRSIRGEKIAPITSKTQGCGIKNPVRVTEVAGVRLSQAVTIECDTAVALKDWIERAMRPAFAKREVVQLRIAAHYVCRGRNNKRGARLSEHSKGKALDIAGFVFSNGTEWSILRDYNKQIRAAHKGACGIFGTTLGPGSDGFHEDHLHFDTASYRSGPYCR